ncbi:MAG TPA: DUF2207 domain-containing protein, partial [Anaerolineae bacterium]|nr:DUF2207 domain-containing protein [Anaerolineae bacterium]
MNFKLKPQVLLLIILSLLYLNIKPYPALAQDKTLVWERYDVNIAVQTNGDLLVEEIQEISFTSGSFSFGFAAIPLDRVERIADVRVAELINGQERSYTANSSQPYGFTTTRIDDNLEITWYFPPTANTTHTYILRYRVIGGLRIYEGGDQVWWKAIPPDHNFAINSATVTVTPPGIFAKDQMVVEAYGAPLSGNPSYTDRGQVVFQAQDIPPDQELEVRVQFPHGVVQAAPPDWQAAADRVQSLGPVVQLLAGALGLFFLVGGPVGVYILWYLRGRDEPSSLGVNYMSEPPSDLPAAVAGTLLDERADVKDIIASLLDLAQRGAIRMQEETSPGVLGLVTNREFVFHLVDPGQATYPHEKRLLERLFGKNYERKTRRLDELRNSFYATIPVLQRMLYDEVIEQGYFNQSPEQVRSRWQGLAFLGLLVAAGAGVCLFVLFAADYSLVVICPAVGLLIGMLSLLVVSHHMPRKTATGTEEAAKWRAFRRYLQNIEAYSDLESIKDKFAQYLPYATAFGLEQRFIRTFSALDTPAPTWWGPVLPYPYGGYYGGGGVRPPVGSPTGGPPGPLAGESSGLPSLSGASESLGSSLAGMSSGLGSLLSSASSTLTSQPQPQPSSSGGWGGGGFSGGGGGGGGGGATVIRRG